MLIRFIVLLTFCTALGARAQIRRAEQFNSDPLTRGWKVFGDSSLFNWNSQSNALEVTWDSSRSNSYFYRPLGTILTRSNDFSVSFSWYPRSFEIGTTPGKPFAFQMAWGFFNYQTATNDNFLRGTGFNSPNIFEFNHFPDAGGFGATLSTILISTNNDYGYGDHIEADDFDSNVLYTVRLQFTSDDQTVRTSMLSNGVPFGIVDDIILGTNFSDFRLDTFSISSYSDEGQDPMWDGSIRANALVDNIVLELPEPPVRNLAISRIGEVVNVSFLSQANWNYVLEHTTNFVAWEPIGSGITSNGGVIQFIDAAPPQERAFYRINATRP